MTKEEKSFLLEDVCQRLPYKVKFNVLDPLLGNITVIPYTVVDLRDFGCYIEGSKNERLYSIEQIKPFLRPLSSITEREKKDLLKRLFKDKSNLFLIDDEGTIESTDKTIWVTFYPRNIKIYVDFMNSHHIDYNDLIKKGLALKAPKGIYTYKK